MFLNKCTRSDENCAIHINANFFPNNEETAPNFRNKTPGEISERHLIFPTWRIRAKTRLIIKASKCTSY